MLLIRSITLRVQHTITNQVDAAIHIANTKITPEVRLSVFDNSSERRLCIICAQVGADGRAVIRRRIVHE
jgi:hypothetical protein